MPRPRPPYLQRQRTRHGGTIWYVRMGRGARTRVHGTFGTAEFMAAYQQAIANATADVPESSKAKTSVRPIAHRDSAMKSRVQESLPPDLAAPAKKTKASVYFIKAGAFVKIGFSSDVKKRADALQTSTAESLEILVTLPGGPELERHFHRKFADQRVGREWFRYRGPIEEFLRGKEAPERPTLVF